MLLRQIQFFVSIVDENSFTEAAEKNYVSQSAVSQAMNVLEADLGVKLIERKNRSFQITTAGEYFYRKCKLLLADLESVKMETIRLGSDKEMILHVGYIKTRKYCIFWPEERTGYYIEEFAEMLRKRLS